MLSDFAALGSKENLELGCKWIKQEVVTKAIRKVREDANIRKAIEQRKEHAQSGSGSFVDEEAKRMLIDLPHQLQPNLTGLTAQQF